MEYYKNLDLEDIYYFCDIDLIWKMEIWNDIPKYKKIYKASDLGRVKSLSRTILKKGLYPFQSKEKISKQSITSRRYLSVSFYKNTTKEKISVHQLVAIAFLNHIPDGGLTQVDHIIEGNKLDNRLKNLQLLTSRENVVKHKKTLKSTSQYIGVSWYKKYNKWRASIQFNGRIKHLGYFDTELEAHLAYEKEKASLFK